LTRGLLQPITKAKAGAVNFGLHCVLVVDGG